MILHIEKLYWYTALSICTSSFRTDSTDKVKNTFKTYMNGTKLKKKIYINNNKTGKQHIS